MDDAGGGAELDGDSGVPRARRPRRAPDRLLGYPGTVTLSVETYLAVLREILDSLARGGFRRITIVNGHGGNAPAEPACADWAGAHPDCQVGFHNWWRAPRTMATVRSYDPVASHASWMESFPWTRVRGPVPKEAKKPVDWAMISALGPEAVREKLGDGSFGGLYQRPDAEMEAIWKVAVEETREAISGRRS